MWKVQQVNTLTSTKEQSSFRIAKRFRELRVVYRSLIFDFFLVAMGVSSAFIGLKGFIIPNNFIDGGVMGISLLIHQLTTFPLGFLIAIISIPFIFLGRKVVDINFAIKTTIAIIGLAIVLSILTIAPVTQDKLLASVFGGFFLGAGIGLCIRGGAVIDGTEVLAIFLSRKFSLTIGDLITLINIIVFSAAAYFLNIESAMYSMITYLAASKTLDFVVEGIEEYVGVSIVSVHSEKFQEMILNTLNRGVTIYSGKRGFGKRGESAEIDIIYTVITRLELNRLKVEIKKIDPNAFVVMSSVNDTIGGMIKKRRLKH